MRCVITGTRDGRADLWHWMRRFAARYGVPELWILGDAKGVDSDAAELCRREGWIHRIYFADWRPMGIYNKLAGFERNRNMVMGADPGDFCLAFPSGSLARDNKTGLWLPIDSKGTRHCIGVAQARGLRVHVIPHIRKIRPSVPIMAA